MKVISSWIQEWLRRTMLNEYALGEALERAGMEIEQISSSKEIDEKIIVALVKKIVQHPGADRLKLVEVETGEGKCAVVCGAPNVREGMRVALAQIGSTLPGGEKIETAKLRGEISHGMLCSERELGLGEDHSGILEVSSEAPLGTPLRELFPAGTVIDLKTPANRWDVLSVMGLAREVAAMTNNELIALSPPPVRLERSSTGVLDPKPTAGRYMLARVKIGAGAHSPRWLTARLQAAGVRTISPVVDVTNYVMLETGQPLHAFDAAKVIPPIAVRPARRGERLVTLDGAERVLEPQDLVIADTTGPIGLAGVMGGQSTEVTPETREIWLEAAVFDGTAVRKTAQRLGLRTEASARFERSLPVALPPLGLARAVELLGQVAEGELVAGYDAPHAADRSWKIALSLSRLREILGFGVSHKEAVEALGRLGIEATGTSTTIIVPKVPWWRPDLREPADLMEEIVRVVGYERVPATIPSWRPQHIEFDRRRAARRRVREMMWAAGAFEVMTYSFVSVDQLKALGLTETRHLKLKNPLTSEQAYLRSGLLASHLAVLERNRMYAKAVRFYEISHVFLKREAGEQPDEPLRFGVTVLEPRQAYAVAKGLLDALGEVLNVELVVRPGSAPAAYAPARWAEVVHEGKVVGGIGQLLPARVRSLKLDGEVAHLEVDLTPLMAASRPRLYAPTSPYPTIARDVALVVPVDVTWQNVREVTAGWQVAFVGDYYGSGLPAGKKSLTIRLTLALPDRTPTEAEAAELEEAVVTRLKHKLGAERRG